MSATAVPHVSLSHRERVPAPKARLRASATRYGAGGRGVMALVATARKLRRDQTDVERKLRFRLRDRRLRGSKFRRQMPIGPHVADFCCESLRLIIELDGGQHSLNTAADAHRTAALEARGYLVLRFWNNDVLQNIDGVLQTIVDTASPEPPHPNPLPTGEREHV
jgi:very-short-patch-repair endonuclease